MAELYASSHTCATLVRMSLTNLVSSIDAEITTLTKVRALLAGLAVSSAAKPAKTSKRTISAAGRKAIAAAQRKRWAAIRKAKS
jgi:hypothetical protein